MRNDGRTVEEDMSVRLGVGGDGAQQPLPGRANAPQRKLSDRLWDILQPLARLWGIITAIVLSGAGAELTVLRHEGAPWLLLGSALVLLLETMWVAALFIDLLARRGEYTLPLRCWDFARWSCGRARAPLYACAATALLLVRPSALASAAGACLLTLASLRAAVPFAPYATHGVHAPRAGTALLSQVDVPDAVYYRGRWMRSLKK